MEEKKKKKMSIERRGWLEELTRYIFTHTHSWCSHGDPRDDHLSDAFCCCFLQEGYNTSEDHLYSVKESYCAIFLLYSADRGLTQLVAVFVCHSDAIQNFPEKT